MDFPLPTWLNTRTAGVLAHVSSLPVDHGIGNLGSGARRFVDFLAGAGLRYWQICPIGPTGYGDSPYSFSRATQVIPTSSISVNSRQPV